MSFTDNLYELVFDRGVMSDLRSELSDLAGSDLRFLSDVEVEERLAVIAEAEAVLHAEKARAVAEAERRKIFALTGHLSVTAWFCDRFHTTWSDALRSVR